jgi:hypothetical protein
MRSGSKRSGRSEQSFPVMCCSVLRISTIFVCGYVKQRSALNFSWALNNCLLRTLRYNPEGRRFDS